MKRISVLSTSMVGIAALIGARSIVCSQEALDALTARAKGDRSAGTPVTERERREAA